MKQKLNCLLSITNLWFLYHLQYFQNIFFMFFRKKGKGKSLEEKKNFKIYNSKPKIFKIYSVQNLVHVYGTVI